MILRHQSPPPRGAGRLRAAAILLVSAAAAFGSSGDIVGTNRSDWEFDGGRWLLQDERLLLIEPATVTSTIRRPGALAVLRTPPLRDLSFSVRLRSVAPTWRTGRDLVLVLGYQGPTEFYYVHLSGRDDDVHTGIFLVAGADRRRIDSGSRYAPLTDSEWHYVRVERKTHSGVIEVYFDDDTVPLTSARDTTLPTGRVGVGSFDDTGEFASITLCARQSDHADPVSSTTPPHSRSDNAAPVGSE